MATTTSSEVALSTAQTGTGDSTNVAFRPTPGGTGAVVITSTVGATPTVTINIQASVDGANYYNVAYATTAAPETPVITALTITTAVTTTYILRPNLPWRYLKLVLSANTNVTITATAFI